MDSLEMHWYGTLYLMQALMQCTSRRSLRRDGNNPHLAQLAASNPQAWRKQAWQQYVGARMGEAGSAST